MPAKLATAAFLALGLIAAGAGPVPRKGEPKKPADPLPALKKLKEAEAAYRTARREAAMELEEAIRKADEEVARLGKALSAVPGRDRDARRKASDAMRQAMEEANALRVERTRLEMPRLGPANPPLPPQELRLHVRLERPGEALSRHLGLATGKGLLVAGVEKDGPAAKAGVQPFDLLVELDGKQVPTDLGGLRKLLAGIKPDAAVSAVVLRQGKREEIKAWILPEAKPEWPERRR
ncbi:MAG: PDZ domain-containing protein [Gemmataceae bacterium]|nr:PDZ domain-containing protein [Gemmataceae bacterium]